jgi:hypothetical protein
MGRPGHYPIRKSMVEPMKTFATLTLALVAFSGVSLGNDSKPREFAYPSGWSAKSPRDEIRPEFSYEPTGGPKKSGTFVIRHDDREGLDGWFEKSFPVTGGEFVRFQAVRKLTGVAVPRRSALVRIVWQNDAGKLVPADVPPE